MNRNGIDTWSKVGGVTEKNLAAAERGCFQKGNSAFQMAFVDMAQNYFWLLPWRHWPIFFQSTFRPPFQMILPTSPLYACFRKENAGLAGLEANQRAFVTVTAIPASNACEDCSAARAACAFGGMLRYFYFLTINFSKRISPIGER